MSFNLEPLFTGIDIIIDKRLEDVAFDKTIICEIRNAENGKNGEYQVSDGSVVFTAYSDNTKYRIGDSVRVTVPQGDYTQKKYIIGKSVTENNISPVSYLSPLDSIVNIDSNLINIQYGIAANGKNNEIPVWGVSLADVNFASLQNNGIYDTITLKANFRTLFNNYNIQSGEYGLRLDIYTKYGEDIMVKNSAYLSSKDMFGNPYAFTAFSTQAATFDISGFENIQTITLTLYQDNNFYDKSFGKIESVTDNILVKDIEVGFGSNIIKIADNTLKIYSLDDPGYRYYGYSESTNLKRIGLQWYNKDDNNKYIGFSDGIYDPEYDEIEYLGVMSADARLLAQKGKINIPTDEDSLNHSANIEETIEWTIKARNLITKDLYQTLNSFALQVAEANVAKTKIDNFKKTLSVVADNINVKLDEIKKIYDIVLTYGYQKQKGDNPEWTTISKTSFVDLLSLFNNVSTDIDDLLISLGEELTSGYLGIYDNYHIRLSKIKETLKQYVDKIPALKDGEFENLEKYKDKSEYKEYAGNAEANKYNNRYCIYWYRQDSSAKSDGFMPDGWVRLEDFDNCGLPVADGEYYLPKADNSDGAISYSMQYDLPEEKFIAVLFYNHQMIKSNELVFTNLDEIPNKSILNDGDMLSFEHVEGGHSYDNYYVYNLTNYLNDIADASHQRQIRCHYTGAAAGDEVFAEAGIYWYMPTELTMLLVDRSILKARGFVLDNNSYPKLGYDCYYKKMSYTKNGEVENFGEPDTRDFWYKIKEYYEPTINNSIICEVRLYGQEDPIFSSITFSFGIEGTSGTRYTMEITNATSQVATTPSDDLILNVALRDRDRNRVKMTAAPGIQDGYIATGFNATWIAVGGGAIGLPAAEVDFITIPKNTYGIVKASASLYDQGIELSTVYPIAWSSMNEAYLSGPTSIVYNSFGTLDNYSMYSKPYKLYNRNTNKEIDNITWRIEYSKDDTFYKQYLPTLNSDNTLTPGSLYLDGLDCYPIIIANQNGTDIWKQPIVIFQNRYSSTMLNDWDGSFQVDEENGTILGTMFGAGRKNTDNTFSGVLMGDVATTAEATVGEMGIYGYNHGGQSFGFKIDGTAFLGKAGAGRILFDGNKGTISSPGWAQNEKKWECSRDTGTLLDLDDAQLLLKGKNGYLYFNNNGDGTLKMSLSGANIQLTDKNNVGLSSYIDITAQEIRTEIKDLDEGLSSSISQTAKDIRLEVAEGDNANKSLIEQTASSIRSEVAAGDGTNKSLIEQTAKDIRLEVSDLESGLQTQITQNANNIGLLIKSDEGLQSQLNLAVDAINAKVSSSGGANGFGWNLTDSGFKLQSTVNNSITDVFVCNKDGITISGNATFTGTVNAKYGHIANWEIGDGYLRNGDTDTTGIFQMYAGVSSPSMTFADSGYRTDWMLTIGPWFGVTSNGNVYCRNGVFKGTIYATDGEFSGDITGASGTFYGNLGSDISTSRSVYCSYLSDDGDAYIGGQLRGVDSIVKYVDYSGAADHEGPNFPGSLKIRGVSLYNYIKGVVNGTYNT